MNDVEIWAPVTIILGASRILELSFIFVGYKDKYRCLLGVGCDIEVWEIGTCTSVEILFIWDGRMDNSDRYVLYMCVVIVVGGIRYGLR